MVACWTCSRGPSPSFRSIWVSSLVRPGSKLEKRPNARPDARVAQRQDHWRFARGRKACFPSRFSKCFHFFVACLCVCLQSMRRVIMAKAYVSTRARRCVMAFSNRGIVRGALLSFAAKRKLHPFPNDALAQVLPCCQEAIFLRSKIRALLGILEHWSTCQRTLR